MKDSIRILGALFGVASFIHGAEIGKLAALEKGEELSGGERTVFQRGNNAFNTRMPGLSEESRRAFAVGNSVFIENFVPARAAAVSKRDGLGPLFNMRSCSGCHPRDGRGHPSMPGDPIATMLMLLSAPERNEHGGPAPDPVYGVQIQPRAIDGVPPEAEVVIAGYEVQERGTFTDGEPYELQKPVVEIRKLNYGPLAEGGFQSLRVPPQLVGLGLLEAVPRSEIEKRADPEDRDGDGISGRINVVWDAAAGSMRLGRFGWKLGTPTVYQLVAHSFPGDIGVTSPAHPKENHTSAQTACQGHPNGGSPEIDEERIQSVTKYLSTLGVPARRDWDDPAVRRGKQIFMDIGCAACHVPSLKTGAFDAIPELAGQTIRPYTDLLLHDMGPESSDNRPEWRAGGEEWRTQPLWGIGLILRVNGHTRFWHDGRARNLTEAILLHLGEGKASREEFKKLHKKDRLALIAFLNSL